MKLTAFQIVFIILIINAVLNLTLAELGPVSITLNVVVILICTMGFIVIPIKRRK